MPNTLAGPVAFCVHESLVATRAILFLKLFYFQNYVWKDHFFFLGDNRDCSKDSRFLSSVGYVHKRNLVGKAQFIFFSSDKSKGNIFSFWKWNKSVRFDRFFKKIK